MADGSSSAAPVMRPRPTARMTPSSASGLRALRAGATRRSRFRLRSAFDDIALQLRRPMRGRVLVHDPPPRALADRAPLAIAHVEVPEHVVGVLRDQDLPSRFEE